VNFPIVIVLLRADNSTNRRACSRSVFCFRRQTLGSVLTRAAAGMSSRFHHAMASLVSSYQRREPQNVKQLSLG
jgi:hypothetical protein